MSWVDNQSSKTEAYESDNSDLVMPDCCQCIIVWLFAHENDTSNFNSNLVMSDCCHHIILCT